MSCGNDDSPPIAPDSVWDCHEEETWNIDAVNSFIVGEWEWEFISCYNSRSSANDFQHSGLVVEIKSDNTLKITSKDQLIQTSNWELSMEDDQLFRLEVNPSIAEIKGRIFICKDKILFDASYQGGCDNYYKRK